MQEHATEWTHKRNVEEVTERYTRGNDVCASIVCLRARNTRWDASVESMDGKYFLSGDDFIDRADAMLWALKAENFVRRESRYRKERGGK